MGGQVGDTGWAVSESGERIRIVNTIKENNLTIHVADRIPSDCSETFTLEVDAARRQQIANNHSATHLLHQALREILGTHVEQKGSYVSDKYFRFDFSHFEKMTDEQIDLVERRVNALVRANYPLWENRAATMEEAKELGAMALFGEKYGDKVRVVKFGDSCELCGGTHTSATGNIGLFKIISESAIAAGVRRIEAATGEQAEMIIDGMENTLRVAKAFFNNAPDLAAAIKKIVEENDSLKKKMEDVIKEKTIAFKNEIASKGEVINGIRIVRIDSPIDPAMLKNASAMLQKEAENLVIAGAFEYEGKPQMLLMYSEDLVKKGHNAGADIRTAAKLIQGGGGGQAGLATAGGKNTEGLGDALALLVELATK